MRLFASCICPRKEAPMFEELWTAYTQEESRLISKGKIQRFEEGDSQAYVASLKKARGRKNFGFQRRNEGRRSAPQGKRDMSKVQCYNSHKFGHYRHDCPEISNDRKRKGKQHATTSNIDEFPKKPKIEESGTIFF